MAKMTTLQFAEHVAIIDSFWDDPGSWSAACDCGWESGRLHKTQADAVEAFDDHCDAVFYEATMEGV